jgi:hypothetical protein
MYIIGTMKGDFRLKPPGETMKNQRQATTAGAQNAYDLVQRLEAAG